jgi:hypothetical protein
MSGDEVRVLFEQFVHLRQSGYGRNDAWFEIESDVRSLAPGDQKRLLAMLQRWEKQIAAQDESATNQPVDPYQTEDKPPEGWEQAREYAAEARRRSVIRRIASPDDRATPGQNRAAGHGSDNSRGKQIACPKCQKLNPAGAVYCYSCGTPMGAATMKANATRPLAGVESDNAYFSPDMVLFLKIQGTGQTLRVEPSKNEMILGRRSDDSVMIPDVDLEPFQAEEQGVSRLHAGLRRQDNTLVLTDLGSKNYTHINGQRLHAHEVRVLHDGDELRLGRLVIYVYFAQG